MRISTKGRQAVMAMVDLSRFSQVKPVSLAEVADRQGISLSYLEQIIAKLKSKALVKSTRGPGGGYQLGEKGDQITVGEIVEAVEDDTARLFVADPMTASVRQLTDLLWQALGDQIGTYLNTVTLSQVGNCTLCVSTEENNWSYPNDKPVDWAYTQKDQKTTA